VDYPGVYLAIAVLALIVALWMTFLLIGFVFKAVFFALIVLVALAVYRAWRAPAPRSRR
jgi:membrane protein implicated in regulation of membrane protease activity